MSSSRAAWIAAASVGAVEALKDQGFCRWNYTIRSACKQGKSNARSVCRGRSVSSQSSEMISGGSVQAVESEESLRKVMYLSCWGAARIEETWCSLGGDIALFGGLEVAGPTHWRK